MSAEFALPIYQEHPTASERIREITTSLCTKIGRIAAATMLVGSGTAIAYATNEIADPTPASAYDSATGDYPWADADHVPKPPASDDITWGYTSKATCDGKSANYDCRTYKEGSYYVYDQWGYYLRNCVSYAAWRLAAEFNIDAAGLGSGNEWDEGAADKGWTVKGASAKPEVGDIAQWNSGNWGHVAFVDGVRKKTDGTYEAHIAEYNQGLDGNFRNNRWVKADKYIDVNGPNAADFKLKVGSSSEDNASTKRQDLAWWTGSILNTRPHDDFAISSATDGLAQPYWADVMDYDGDKLDDVILFRENGGDIKVIRKNPQGGWLPISEAVRGPNIAPPLWAATADLDNNGKDNDLIWWSPTGISKLVGKDLNTKSTTTGIAAPDWADVIDYNQDGRDDVVLYRPDGSLRVLLNSASGGWDVAAPNPVRTGVTQPVWAGVGDFDGDGKARELAWWNASGSVSILNGANRFALTATTPDITPPEWADVMDYDGDGKDDIVFYRQSDGTLNILRKSPTGDGFYLLADNPIRGPGVSAPSWAGVGDFTK